MQKTAAKLRSYKRVLPNSRLLLRFFYFPYIRKFRYFDTNPIYLLYICTC